ncbi:phosphoribosyltransferase family protein [Brachybacterium sp. DNPG3]
MIRMFARRDGQIVPDGAATGTFPAGEQHIVPAAAPVGLRPEDDPLAIVVQGASAEDLVSAAMAVDAAHRAGRPAALVLPYLPGARADRGIPVGAAVYARMIDAAGADRVLAIDPHSPVMPSLVAHLEIHPLPRLVRRTLAHRIADGRRSPYVGVIAPDAGAVARAGAVAAALELPLLRAEKHRDFATGRLSGFRCEPLPEEGRLLVVDDICDGGGTFVGLAEATGLGPDRLDLWVTHGVFSGRAGRLRERFGAVHTTDSHPGHTNPEVDAVIHPIVPTLIREALS